MFLFKTGALRWWNETEDAGGNKDAEVQPRGRGGVGRSQSLGLAELLLPRPSIVKCDAAASGEAKNGFAKGLAELPPLPESSDKEEKPELIKEADEVAKGAEETVKFPGQFQDQFGETKHLVNIDTFDGFRFELHKPITPTFAVNHTLWMGTSLMKSGGYYQCGATVAEDGDRLLLGRMDHDCNLEARVHHPLAKNLVGKLMMQAGQNDHLQGTFDYTGKTFAGQATVAKGPQIGFSYNQALTPRVSVGGEGLFHQEQKIAAMTYGFKYNAPKYACTGLYANGMVQMQYVRRVVPSRVTLGAEFVGTANMEQSSVSLGAEFQFKQSKYAVSLEGTGKIDSALECKLSPFHTLLLTGQLNHAEDKMRFGFGLQMGQ